MGHFQFARGGVRVRGEDDCDEAARTTWVWRFWGSGRPSLRTTATGR